MSVVLIGAESLREISKPVIDFDDSLIGLVNKLFDTLNQYHGVGIAAPQIGVNQRVFIYGFKENVRYPNEKPIPDTVMINPVILSKSEATLSYMEGCLSVPNLRGEVTRAESIEGYSQNIKGEIVPFNVSGFEARIIQHELDHLDGILFIDKVKDPKTLVYV